MRLKLRALVDAMANQNDDNGAYYDLETGDLVSVPHAIIGQLETSDELDERWVRDQFEQVLLARLLLTAPDRFLLLPDKRELRDWEIMDSFVGTIADDEQRSELQKTLQGRGAFKRFKNSVYELGLIDDWFKIRRIAYEKVALAWCQRHAIDVESDS